MAWGYKATITIDNTKVSDADSADLSNFPILISGTYDGTGGEPDLRVTGSGGKMTSSSGYDIGFYSDSGLTTALKYERELHNTTTGAVIYWVKIPTLTYASDTVIYMAYGDSGITTDQSDADNTWDNNYLGVWHMSDGADNQHINDSSGGSHTGTKAGAGTPAQDTGLVHYSQDNNSNNIDCSSADFNLTNNITLEAWVKLDAANSSKYVLTYRSSNDQYAIIYGFNAGKYEWYSENGGGRVAFNTGVTDTTTYHYIATTYTSSHVNCYLDGTNDRSVDQATTITGATRTLRFFAALSYSGQMNAHFDEFRISNIVRTAGWIATTFNTINSPSTFYAMGSEGAANDNPVVNWNSEPVKNIAKAIVDVSKKSQVSTTGTVPTGNVSDGVLRVDTLNGDLYHSSGSTWYKELKNAGAGTLTIGTAGTIQAKVGTIGTINGTVGTISTLSVSTANISLGTLGTVIGTVGTIPTLTVSTINAGLGTFGTVIGTVGTIPGFAFSTAVGSLIQFPSNGADASYTYVSNVSGTEDGFKIRWLNTGIGLGTNNDAIVFDKVDGNNDPPDGAIQFAMTGTSGVSTVAMNIAGNKNVSIYGTLTAPDAVFGTVIGTVGTIPTLTNTTFQGALGTFGTVVGTVGTISTLTVPTAGTFGSGSDYLVLDKAKGIRLYGTTTCWEDAMVDIGRVRSGPTGTAPTWGTFNNAEVLEFNDGTINSISFFTQIPHKARVGGSVEYHLHTSPPGTAAGSVVWQFTHSWTPISGSFPTPSTVLATQVIDANSNNKHLLVDMGYIGTNPGISSMMACSLTRIGTATEDNFSTIRLLQSDFHYEVDSMGSDGEATKT